MDPDYWSLSSSDFEINGKTLLEKIEIKIGKGSCFFLLGPNGCGKTSFLKLAAGLEKNIMNIECGSEKVPGNFPHRSNWISFLPNQEIEDFGLKSMAVIELARYGSKWKQFGSQKDLLESLIFYLDLEMLLERSFDTLSLGEKRRVSIARVLYQDTDLILMDEPTSALDLGHRERFWELVSSLGKQGKTFVLAVHELNEALRYGQSGLILKGGRIFSVGKLDEIINQSTLHQVWDLRDSDWILKK